MDKIYFKPKKIIGYNKQISSPTRWSSMHWKAVSKQWRCWAIITSLSGMKEKFLMIFEAATAHCCFSARPSSSKLNRPSSSSHNSVKRDFVTPLCCVDSVPAEPDPTLHKENHPTMKFILLPPHLQKKNIQLIEKLKTENQRWYSRRTNLPGAVESTSRAQRLIFIPKSCHNRTST